MSPAPMHIAPSLLAVFDTHGPDFTALTQASLLAQAAGAAWLHIDVMEPPTMPRSTFQPSLLPILRKAGVNVPLDVHLMSPITPYLADFANAGASHLCFHPKGNSPLAVANALDFLQQRGICAGLALDTDEELESIEKYIKSGQCQQVTIMTVKAGAGGQAFQPAMLGKVEKLRKMAPALPVVVDGGINAKTIGLAQAAGATMAVVGSAVFGAANPAAAIAELLEK